MFTNPPLSLQCDEVRLNTERRRKFTINSKRKYIYKVDQIYISMLAMYSTTSIDQMRSATELNFEPMETRMVRLDRISVIQERDTTFIAFCTLNAPS